MSTRPRSRPSSSSFTGFDYEDENDDDDDFDLPAADAGNVADVFLERGHDGLVAGQASLFPIGVLQVSITRTRTTTTTILIYPPPTRATSRTFSSNAAMMAWSPVRPRSFISFSFSKTRL